MTKQCKRCWCSMTEPGDLCSTCAASLSPRARENLARCYGGVVDLPISTERVKRDVMRILDLLARQARQARQSAKADDLVRLRERLVWAAIHYLAPPGDDDDVVRQRVEEAMVKDKDIMVALTGEVEGRHEYTFRAADRPDGQTDEPRDAPRVGDCVRDGSGGELGVVVSTDGYWVSIGWHDDLSSHPVTHFRRRLSDIGPKWTLADGPAAEPAEPEESSIVGDGALRPAALIFEREGEGVYRIDFDTVAEAVSRMERLAKSSEDGKGFLAGDQLLLPGCSMVVETTDGPPHTWIRLHEGPE